MNTSKENNNIKILLYLSIFMTGITGMLAEHILALVAINLFSNSITWYVTIISFSLFGMGLGALVSQLFNDKNLIFKFLLVELTLSILGSLVAILNSYIYSLLVMNANNFIIIYSTFIGVLIGMEIPLIARINQKYELLKKNISNIMSLDYIGSLIAGILYIHLCLEYLGINYTSIFLSLLNAFVAFFLFIATYKYIIKKYIIYIGFAFIMIINIFVFIFGEQILNYCEQAAYKDKIIAIKQTKHQKLVLTERYNNIDQTFYYLFINKGLQWCSRDEYIYHESLVVPFMNSLSDKDNLELLVIGGGDGMALREIFKYPNVKNVTLVDLDKTMINWHKENNILRNLNQDSLYNKKLTIFNEDAISFMINSRKLYDGIIIDLVDPVDPQLSRLYSTLMYNNVFYSLKDDGILTVQSTSSYYTKKAFLSIHETLKSVGFNSVIPYHVLIPSFGDWGFNIASKNLDEKDLKKKISHFKYKPYLEYLDHNNINSLFYFSKNYFKEKVEISTLNNFQIYKYYLKGSQRY